MKKGFTLVELLVVMIIISILAVVVLLNLDRAKSRSRDAQRKSDLTLLSGAMDSYKVDHKEYIKTLAAGVPVFLPADSTTLALLLDDNGATAGGGSYISAIPRDPNSTTTTPLYYRYISDGNQFKIVALSETVANPNAREKAGDFYNPTGETQLQISSTSFALNNWTYTP